MSDTSISNAQDVVEFLKAQHDQVKQLFERVLEVDGDLREQSFLALRRLLAVHETAEEEIVHPRAKKTIEDGDTIVAARLEEEREAKEKLAKLEKLDVSTAEFETQFRLFRQDVLAHAEAEERDEFPRLARDIDEHTLHKMRRAVETAESMAPTRPHAGVESKTANMLAGPFAMMLDRARDRITGKSN
ncbi:MAG TPA: hemerythrin domain-containing protein [Jatrophihabitans sp.]|nr:hemerythrin domain-containing protein [Jatrophihabitans sp.]